MRKRPIVLLCGVLCGLSLIGCASERNQSPATEESSESAIAATEEDDTEQTAEEVTADADNETVTDCTGQKYIYFGDHQVPIDYVVKEDLGSQAASGKSVHAYLIEADEEYMMEACHYEGTTVATIAEQIRNLGDQDKPPVTDIHSEGTYVTMMREDHFILSFITEGLSDDVYVAMVHGTDTRMMDVTESICDSLLASDITKSSMRTEYGQPVNAGETGDASSSGNTDVAIETGAFPVDISSLGKADYEGSYFSSWYTTSGGEWKDVEFTVSRGADFDNMETFRDEGEKLGELFYGGLTWDCYNYAYNGEPLYVLMLNETDGIYNYMRITSTRAAKDVSELQEYLDAVL